jgi:hypothetical protein
MMASAMGMDEEMNLFEFESSDDYYFNETLC